MKAATYKPEAKENSHLVITELKKPVLKNNNAIIKVKGVGVCGSDLLKLDRALVKPGTVLGHELVGIIDEISDEMSEKYNFKKGDRIISSHHVPCLECDFCLKGQESLCKQFKSTNFMPGAFCDYLELSEGHLKHTVQKVPNHLSDEEASFTEPVACCIKALRSCERDDAAIQSSKYLVIGLGSIGLIIGQLIKHYSPNSELTGLDLDKDRLKLATELRFDTTSLRGAEGDAAIQSYDYIFLCAGANATIDLAIKHAKAGATIVVFSSTPGQASFSNNDIYYKELTIMGSYSPNLENLKESLELISSGKIKVDKLITHKTNLENLGKIIAKAKKEKGIKTYLELN